MQIIILLVRFLIGYFDHTLRSLRLSIKFSLNQRAELATEGLEDRRHIVNEVVGRGLKRFLALLDIGSRERGVHCLFLRHFSDHSGSYFNI